MKKTGLSRDCELFQWSLEGFLGKRPNASPKTQWSKDWKAFEKLVREEIWAILAVLRRQTSPGYRLHIYVPEKYRGRVNL